MRRRDLRTALLLVTVVVLFWAIRLVAAGRDAGYGSHDLRVYFYPTYAAFYGSLARGHLIAWNPYQLCGLPWLGTLQGGFFYPPHVLYLLLPTHLALAASGLLHLVLIGLATMLLVRRAGVRPEAALLAALLFTLRGFVPELIRWPYFLEAGAWLPFGCLAVLDLARGLTRRGVALLATAAGMSWLAGCPQATVFLLYAWSALLLAALLGARARPGRWLTTTATFAAALALGTLAGAVQLVPAMEMVREGTRAARQLDVALMSPMGDPGLGLLRDAVSGSRLSFGIVGLSLVPAAFGDRRTRVLAAWALGTGVLALAFALGPATPLFRGYLLLPALGWFRGPHRVRLLADFCFAVLAAVAAGAVFRERDAPAPREAAPGVWLPLLCGVGIGAYALLRGAYLTAALGLGTVLALLARERRWAMATVVALATVEMFLSPPSEALLPYGAASAASYRAYADAWSALAEAQGSERVWLVRSGFSPPGLAERLSTVYRVRSLDDYEPVTLRRQADYFTYLLEGRTRSTWTFSGQVGAPPVAPWPLTARRRLLDVAAVRLLLAPATNRPVRDFAGEAGLVQLPAPARGLAFYENRRAVPRAYVVHHTEPAPPPDELLARMSDPGFDPMRMSYVEGDPGLDRGTAIAGHPASIVRDEEELVEIEATLAAPGLLVLADSYYPGWQAAVDGVPARIVPTNHLFRGVTVPAGRHRVRFSYDRTTLRLGAATSFAAALAIGLLFRPRIPGGARRSGPAPSST